MSTKRSLYALLGELAMARPKLVLMQGRKYFRIEDLWRWARRDWAVSDSKERAALSETIYWIEEDKYGKLLLKGAAKNSKEFLTFVEPGSDEIVTLE
jgi:hypothetical protein